MDLAYDLKVKESFLMKRLKSLIQRVKIELNKLPDENIDKSFKDKYTKDILLRIKKLENCFS